VSPTYNHYCPVARALEVVGDRWSLLIIRDLLRKPQRFTDLLHYSSNITPKRLTDTLRRLEEAGIVERESQPSRREVWYRLTPVGRDFAPVVAALGAWGLRYAMRPPLPGEVVHPDLAIGTTASSLNRRSRKLAQPATWLIRFLPGGDYTLSFCDDRWSVHQGSEMSVDVTLTITPEAWATFLAIEREKRGPMSQTMQIEGAPERVKEFLNTFGVRDKDG